MAYDGMLLLIKFNTHTVPAPKEQHTLIIWKKPSHKRTIGEQYNPFVASPNRCAAKPSAAGRSLDFGTLLGSFLRKNQGKWIRLNPRANEEYEFR